MRHKTAFQFIPELIGDFGQVVQLSENPKLLFVQAAVEAVHSATAASIALAEHMNTKRKKETLQEVKQKHNDLETSRIDNLRMEAVRELDITYERLKFKIQKGQLQDREVHGFIICLKEELHKLVAFFHNTQVDPDYSDRANVEENTRRTIRAYKNILTIYMEEDENNGQG